MPKHTQKERRANRAPKIRAAVDKSAARKAAQQANRAAGGNQQTGRLQQAFRAARSGARQAANTVGQVGRAAVSEVAGVAGQAVRGLGGQGPSAAAIEGAAPQATPAQQAAKRIGERARRAFRGGRGSAARNAGGNLGGGFTRAEALQRFEGGQRSPSRLARAGRGLGRFARGAVLPGAAIAIGAEATKPTAELEAQSGLPQITPLRGEQPAGQAPGAQAPVNLERFGDPLLAAARPAVGAVRGAFGLGAEQEATAQQPAQPAGLRGAQFDETGARQFGNADIGGGAANRGTASVEENQAVAGRLDARGQAERAAGLRQQGGQQTLLDRLGQQAAGGGLASAFAALNVGGNQLRREAADRSRANASATSAAAASNKLNLELTKIGAQSQVNKSKNFAKDAVGFSKSVNDAIASGDPEQVANIRSSVFEAAAKDPEGPASAAAANLVAEDIRSNTQSGFFGALFNPFDAFFKGERGPLDAIKSLGQGGFNNEFQSAVDKLTLNESSGQLEIANPDGSGGTQEVAEFTSLSPETREFLSQRGLRKVGAGQQVTRGDPNRLDPNRPSLRSGL